MEIVKKSDAIPFATRFARAHGMQIAAASGTGHIPFQSLMRHYSPLANDYGEMEESVTPFESGCNLTNLWC